MATPTGVFENVMFGDHGLQEEPPLGHDKTFENLVRKLEMAKLRRPFEPILAWCTKKVQTYYEHNNENPRPNVPMAFFEAKKRAHSLAFRRTQSQKQGNTSKIRRRASTPYPVDDDTDTTTSSETSSPCAELSLRARSLPNTFPNTFRELRPTSTSNVYMHKTRPVQTPYPQRPTSNVKYTENTGVTKRPLSWFQFVRRKSLASSHSQKTSVDVSYPCSVR